MNKAVPWAMRHLCKGALILAPDFVRRSFRCAYPTDVNTLSSPDACGRSSVHNASKIGVTLQQQLRVIENKTCLELDGSPLEFCYNELVFNLHGPEGWYEQMPRAIQAWVVDEHKWHPDTYGSIWRHYDCESQMGEVRWEHEAFLAYFNLTAAEVPLVYFDRRNLDAPFYLPQQSLKRPSHGRETGCELCCHNSES